MRRRPHIHVGIMKDKILNVHKLARNPHACGRIEEMRPFDKAFPHRTTPHRLVEASDLILRCRFYFAISNVQMSYAR